MTIATYTLMHRDIPTVTFAYDTQQNLITKVVQVHNVQHAPLNVQGRLGGVSKRALNTWWKERPLLASDNRLRDGGIPWAYAALTLPERSYCLSLSDCYWVDDDAHPQRWQDINYFDNDFATDLNLVPTVHAAPRGTTLIAHTIEDSREGEVEQRKKWVIAHGKRSFIKAGGFSFNQAAFNEVVATRLFHRLLQPGEYVPYSLYEDELGAFCLSAIMLGPDEELIPLYDILRWRRKPPGVPTATYLARRVAMTGAFTTVSTAKRELWSVTTRLEELGVPDPQGFLAKMFVCDYILSNDDRHYCNFGVIRDAKTLEFKRMAPIYDTGLCLWCRAKQFESPADFNHEAKPFRPKGMDPDKQLALFHRYEWFDQAALEGFPEEAKAILDKNPYMPAGRTKLIQQGLRENIQHVIQQSHTIRG